MEMRVALKELTVKRPVATNALIVFCTAWLAFPAIVSPPYGTTGFGWVDILIPLNAVFFFHLWSRYIAYRKPIYVGNGMVFYERHIWLCVSGSLKDKREFLVDDHGDHFSTIEQARDTYLGGLTIRSAALNSITYWWCWYFPEDFRKRLLRNNPRFSSLFEVETLQVKLPETVRSLIEQDDLDVEPSERVLFGLKLKGLNTGPIGWSGATLVLARELHAKQSKPLI